MAVIKKSSFVQDKFFSAIKDVLLLKDANDKCIATLELAEAFKNNSTKLASFISKPGVPSPAITRPGLPDNLKLLAPRHLKKRSIQSQTGRTILMHAIAHIEFNAINLALDAAHRFEGQPFEYYQDWIQIAADEARHFNLIRTYLKQHDCDYGDYPAHNGLWDMAMQTADDIIARMALVPRVLEARGLDVTPGMIERLESVNDRAAVNILTRIYADEIGHVNIGTKWFHYHCELRQLEPSQTFKNLIKARFHGKLKGPFNIQARRLAGFSEDELKSLQT